MADCLADLFWFVEQKRKAPDPNGDFALPTHILADLLADLELAAEESPD